jgi:hypothetical protein
LGGREDGSVPAFPAVGVFLLFAFMASIRCLINSLVRALCSSVTVGLALGVVVATWFIFATGAGVMGLGGSGCRGGLDLAEPACFAAFAA